MLDFALAFGLHRLCLQMIHLDKSKVPNVYLLVPMLKGPEVVIFRVGRLSRL